MANLNPLDIRINDISIEKFNKKDKISLLPQVIETTIYQSIWEPVVKAEMLINDPIGLLSNYPLTGEELITIRYEQIVGSRDDRSSEKTLKFIIKGVRNFFIGDRARSTGYIIDLVSPYALQNLKKYVSHSYYDTVEDMAEKVYNEYLADETYSLYKIKKSFRKEKSAKVRHLIVPNLRPFAGMKWLAKHAVSKDFETNFTYLFYEDLQQFNFITVQQLVKEAKAIKDTIIKKKYVYASDTEIYRKDKNSDPDQEYRLITNMTFNRRLATVNKLAGGYFQNELLEISMIQKNFNSTVTELANTEVTPNALGSSPLNTPEYITYVKNQAEGTEYANRIRYIINNYEDFSDEGKSQPSYRLKFGNTTKYMHALNQLDITITVPANMNLRAGDIIYVDIPEMHGFNQVNKDKFLSGLFLVSEVKTTISSAGRAICSLRINKDSYTEALFKDMLYNKDEDSRR